MSGIKKCVVAVRGMMRKLLFGIKLFEMDWWWRFTGADSWGLFPPSFYRSHTKEDAERIREETVKSLREMINDKEM